jgi:hypothetical protein
MNVHRLAANGVIACASSLTLAACSIGLITVTPASATNAATASVAGQSVPAGASPSVRGGENFQMMTTSGTATTMPVIAWGLFTAAGTDHEKGVVHTFAFPGGTFHGLCREFCDAVGRLGPARPLPRPVCRHQHTIIELTLNVWPAIGHAV